MTQTSLFDMPASRPRKRGHVPMSSVEAGRLVNRDQRARDALECIETLVVPCTSAEMASHWFQTMHPNTDQKLYLRRGLSDAQEWGFVEHAGERMCAVSGRTCVTWKLRTR